MTTLCIVAGTSPLLTGILEPSGPVARGELRFNLPLLRYCLAVTTLHLSRSRAGDKSQV